MGDRIRALVSYKTELANHLHFARLFQSQLISVRLYSEVFEIISLQINIFKFFLSNAYKHIFFFYSVLWVISFFLHQNENDVTSLIEIKLFRTV